MLARIITIEKPWGKYVQRTNYVKNRLLPQMCGLGLDCQLFPAVTTDVVCRDNAGYIVHIGSRFLHIEGSVENFLSNLNIWREAIVYNEPILILEDDAQLLPENEAVTIKAIKDWNSMDGHWVGTPEILYLLSSVPYLKDRLKDYPEMQSEGPVSLVPNSWPDFAGTAAYIVTPRAAERLISLAIKDGILATDKFLQTAINRGLVNCVVPVEYKRCFTLHPELYWG